MADAKKAATEVALSKQPKEEEEEELQEKDHKYQRETQALAGGHQALHA